MKQPIYTETFVLGFCFCFIILAVITITESKITDREINVLEKDIINIIEDTNKFYKYNITDDDIIRNRTELIKYGGDCGTWSSYYQSLLKDRYNTTIQKFNTKPGYSHVYLVVNDDIEYCIIDQLNYVCYKYS